MRMRLMHVREDRRLHEPPAAALGPRRPRTSEHGAHALALCDVDAFRIFSNCGLFVTGPICVSRKAERVGLVGGSDAPSTFSAKPS